MGEWKMADADLFARRRLLNSHIIGQKFGRWTVLENCLPKFGARHVNCRCECGTIRDVRLRNLRRNTSSSCGCLHRELKANGFHITHGCARKGLHSPEYRTWESMLRRVRATKGKHYRDYVLRGVIVCDRWLVFENFLADMGPRPSSKHSIDRINNDGNYEPGNCRWATARQQRLNQRSKSKLLNTTFARRDF